MKCLHTASVLLLCIVVSLSAEGSNQKVRLRTAELKPLGTSANFGNAVATDRDTVVVGAMATVVDGRPSGAAYVFVRPPTGWTNMTQTAMLTASDNDAYHLGAAVAISGDTIVVGAPWTMVNGILQEGAVYVYVKPAGGWTNMTETAKLTGFHVDSEGYDWIGSTVSIDGDTIVAGVPNVTQDGNSFANGEAFVYVRPPSGWTSATETAVLYSPPDGFPNYGLGFGASVGISSGTIVVGATGCCSNGESTVGSAYVFVEPAGGWVSTDNYNAELTGTEVGPNDFFGYAVAIEGNTIVVGSPQTESYQVGAAYIYVEPTGGWTDMTQTAELYPLPAVTGNFGESLAIREKVILIGAPNTSLQYGQQGKAYVFVEPKSGWRTTYKCNASLTLSGAYNFGESISISGGTAVIGDGGSSNGGPGEAIVYSVIK